MSHEEDMTYIPIGMTYIVYPDLHACILLLIWHACFLLL